MKAWMITGFLLLIATPVTWAQSAQATPADDTLFQVQTDKGWGYIDGSGKEVIKPQFVQGFPFAEGLAWVVVKGTPGTLKYGVIDTQGRYVLEPQRKKPIDCLYVQGHSLVRGLPDQLDHEATAADVKYQCLDATGKVTCELPPGTYADSHLLSNGLIVFRMAYQAPCGLMTTDGKVLLEPTYDTIREPREGFYPICQKGQWGFMDEKLKVAVKPQFEKVGNFSGGLALAVRNKLYGFIDSAGKTVVPLKYSYANDFSEGLALVRYPDKREGFITPTGQEAFPARFLDGQSYSDGLAVVHVDAQSLEQMGLHGPVGNRTRGYGYIDHQGRLAGGWLYGMAWNFTEGRALVKEAEDRIGYVNPSATYVIPAQYLDGIRFRHGWAMVSEKDPARGPDAQKVYYIDRSGRRFWTILCNDHGNNHSAQRDPWNSMPFFY